MLEDLLEALRVLRRANDKGNPRRGNRVAPDLAGSPERSGVIRTVALATGLLIGTSVGVPFEGRAQTPAQGQAVGILFLLTGLSPQARAQASLKKQQARNLAPDEVEGRIVGVRPQRLPSREGNAVVRLENGGAVTIPGNLARQSELREGSLIRVKYDARHGQKVARSVEFRDALQGQRP